MSPIVEVALRVQDRVKNIKTGIECPLCKQEIRAMTHDLKWTPSPFRYFYSCACTTGASERSWEVAAHTFFRRIAEKGSGPQWV